MSRVFAPNRIVVCSTVLLSSLLGGPQAFAQDRIILRNTVVVNGPVLAFDEDGIQVKGREVGWDEVESGKVAKDQPKFDLLLKELGDGLFKIRKRLESGDHRDAFAYAHALYPRYAGRRSATAYRVAQALMWGAMANGQREAALEPYIHCLEFLRGRHMAKTPAPELPGIRRLTVDFVTGLTPDLDPVWFEPALAKAALPGVRKALKAVTAPLPAVYLYAGTLALSAGEPVEGNEYLDKVDRNDPALRDLVGVLLAQKEVETAKRGPALQTLESRFDALQRNAPPLAYYWLGQAFVKSKEESERKKGLLYLLYLPALYGEQSPELAAAGLYLAAEHLGKSDSLAVQRLRAELLGRYGQTHFGARLAADLKLPKGNAEAKVK